MKAEEMEAIRERIEKVQNGQIGNLGMLMRFYCVDAPKLLDEITVLKTAIKEIDRFTDDELKKENERLRAKNEKLRNREYKVFYISKDDGNPHYLETFKDLKESQEYINGKRYTGYTMWVEEAEPIENRRLS